MLECFQWILFDTQPVLASWELRLSLPCREDIWKCASKSEWEELSSIPETCIASPVSLHLPGRVVAGRRGVTVLTEEQ